MTKTNELLSSEALGFDPDALAQRYAEEREKRIRPDAETQFVQLSHDSPFANKYLEEDPYSETLERAPLKRPTRSHRDRRWLGRYANRSTVKSGRYWRRPYR